MKGDIPEAAFRLMQSLPVREHHAPQPQEPNYYRKRVDVKPHDSRPKPIKVRGKVYSSITEARRVLRVATTTIHTWLDTGRAEYVKEQEWIPKL